MKIMITWSDQKGAISVANLAFCILELISSPMNIVLDNFEFL